MAFLMPVVAQLDFWSFGRSTMVLLTYLITPTNQCAWHRHSLGLQNYNNGPLSLRLASAPILGKTRNTTWSSWAMQLATWMMMNLKPFSGKQPRILLSKRRKNALKRAPVILLPPYAYLTTSAREARTTKKKDNGLGLQQLSKKFMKKQD